ncbi:MAG: DUF2889 domain-containing protein [Actinomycetota bacterium]
MDGQFEPRWTDASESSAGVSAEYERLAAGVGREPARFARDVRTRVHRHDGGSTLICELDDDFHSIRVAVRLDPSGTILASAGQIARAPYAVCPRALDSLDSLVGANILAPGIRSLLRDRIPRADGCIHLSDMLAAAFHVYRISIGHDMPRDIDDRMRRALLKTLPLMRDSCIAFAVDRQAAHRPADTTDSPTR